MPQLESYLGAFLRQLAILEGIRELRLFADAEQELGLGEQRDVVHSGLGGAAAQRREVDVRSDVLLTGSFVRRSTRAVLPVRHQRIAMAAGKLLLARIAVVDEHGEP